MCHTRCHTVPPKREQGTFFFYCCVIGYFGPETEMDEHLTHRRPVVVAIGGFLCGGGDAKQRMYSFWGIPITALEAQGFRVITVSPSPVGSLHDRACQIFYELKGGTLCYGEEHSRSHGHACHGETNRSGSFSAWAADNPIHLMGHSFGGQTARVLQHLLATGFFSKPGEYRTSAAWVRSLTACNSPLNGSLLVYSLGERAETAPAVRLGSQGHILSVVIHVLELLDLGFLRRIFDTRLSHFQMSWRHLGWRRACVEVARAIAGDSVIFARPDNAAFDMTVHSASRYNQEIRTDPNTFYFSLAGSRPERPSEEELLARASGSGRARWFYRISPRPLSAETASKGVVTKLIYWVLRQLHVRQVGGHERVVESLFGVAAESWDPVGHDGVLEAFTQSHPRVPAECEAPFSVGLPDCPSALMPGVWHTLPVWADHMWAHVDKVHARDAFERLAHCLRLVAEQPDAAGSMPEPRRDGVRRSPRLLAKAQRARIAQAARIGRGVTREEDDADFLGGAAGCKSYYEDGGIRCNVCAMEGVTGADENLTGINGSSSVNGIDGTALRRAVSHRRVLGLWTALLVFALIVAGMVFAIVCDESGTSGIVPMMSSVFVSRTCPVGEELIGLNSSGVRDVESAPPGAGDCDAPAVLGVGS